MSIYTALRSAIAVALILGCREAPARTAADSQAAHVREVVASGGVVDSILPIAEHLTRFRATLRQPPDTLRAASTSIEDLVARWATAVTRRDTAALNAMVIDASEFAWFYYPDSKMSKPPYEAPPGLLWGQLLASSNEGARTLLTRYGGKGVRVDSVRCPDSVVVEGANRLHDGCRAAVRIDGASAVDARWFGTILERDGRFKFVGLSNSL